MIIFSQWQTVPHFDQRDIDQQLIIAGYVATISWRADYISWEVRYAASDTLDGSGYPADSNALIDEFGEEYDSRVPEMRDKFNAREEFTRARSEAESAILALIAETDALAAC